MTEQDTTEADEATAAAELAALEQAAEDGEAVTPTALAEAREKVTIASLLARGRAKRAAAQQALAEAEKRAQAKRDAAALLATTSDPLDAARTKVSEALGELLREVEAHNERVREAARTLDDAGLVHPNRQQTVPMDVPGIDVDNYVWWNDGLELSFVQAGGATYAPARALPVALGAVNAAMQAHHLPILEPRR